MRSLIAGCAAIRNPFLHGSSFFDDLTNLGAAQGIELHRLIDWFLAAVQDPQESKLRSMD